MIGKSLVQQVTEALDRKVTIDMETRVPFAGLEPKVVYVDESSRISEKTVRHAAAATSGRFWRSPAAPAPRVKSINIPCRRCGAPAGTKCVMWMQRRSRQIYKPHAIRVRDAKLANTALDALKPR